MQPSIPEEIPRGAEQPRQSLPQVTQETRDKLFSEMGIDNPTLQFDRNSPEGFDKWQKIQDGVRDTLSTTLFDMADANHSLVQAFNETAMTNGVAGGYLGNEYAYAIALVTRVFHIHSDYKLIGDLVKLSPQDIAEITGEMGTGIKKMGNSSLFDIALNMPRIPENQSFLREIAETPPKINSNLFGTRYRSGVGLMYGAMEKIWGKLYSNEAQPPQVNPPPQPLNSPPQA